MIQYRCLTGEELCPRLFKDFNRRQEVTKCWRREKGQWVIKDDPFIDDWSKEDYVFLVSCLKNTVATGGFVYAGFKDGQLKGFVSVESELFGKDQEYMDLTSIHVSAEMRHEGMGKVLFEAAKQWAKAHGAKKLYISSHSEVESQAFYKSMGCVEAREYDPGHVEKEPFDCQLECVL